MEILDLMMIFMLVGVCIAILLFIMQMLKFKHTVVIRQITGTKKYIIADKAKEEKIDGVYYWKLKKLKDVIPIPPPDAVDISKRGKLFVEAYRNNMGEYQFIRDKGTPEFFQPLTTNQRIGLVNQYRKAELKRGKHWTEQLPLYVGIAFVTICFVSWLVFAQDIYKPLTEAQQSKEHQATLELEKYQILQEIKTNTQVIRDTQNKAAQEQAPN